MLEKYHIRDRLGAPPPGRHEEPTGRFQKASDGGFENDRQWAGQTGGNGPGLLLQKPVFA
jgi:hypothetical protein